MDAPTQTHPGPANLLLKRHSPKGVPGCHAEPPRPPQLPASLLQQTTRVEAYLRTRGALERSSAVRGLMWLALVALAVSTYRAGWERSFFGGWWRQW